MSDFNINDLNLSDEDLGTDKDWESYAEPQEFPAPPDPGKYRAVIARIREIKESGDPKRIVASMDYTIRGGQFDGRSVNFVYVSNREFERAGQRASTMSDLIRAAGIFQAPSSNRQFAVVLDGILQRQTTFPLKIDWRGYCPTCYAKKITQLTGTQELEIARSQASDEEDKAAREFATKAKNFRGFPLAKDGKTRLDIMECADCGNEVRARANVVGYFA